MKILALLFTVFGLLAATDNNTSNGGAIALFLMALLCLVSSYELPPRKR